MDPSEIEKIRKVLHKLVEATFCSSQFIAYLHSKNVIGRADVSKLESIRNEMDKAERMYRMLLTRRGAYTFLVEALNRTNQSGALEILEEDFYVPSVAKAKVYSFNVKRHTPLFTGRVHELASLREYFEKGQKISQSTTVSITGLPGMGKTELAVKFIHSIDFQENDPLFHSVVWLNAEKEQTLDSDFRALAHDINVSHANDTAREIQTIVRDVFEKLGNEKSLFVFDNVENCEL